MATTTAVIVSWPPLLQPLCYGYDCHNRWVVATIVAAAAAMPVLLHRT
jgi:hypothetical protein